MRQTAVAAHNTISQKPETRVASHIARAKPANMASNTPANSVLEPVNLFICRAMIRSPCQGGGI